MNASEFAAYAAQGFNRIPLSRVLRADLDTPLSVYLKLVDGGHSYLLESVQGGEKWGRHSIIGLPARTIYEVRGTKLRIIEDGEIIQEKTVTDPLAEIEAIQRSFRVPRLPDLPDFAGGFVGYFGHGCVAYIEPKLAEQSGRDELGMPDIVLMLAEEIAVFDNLKGTLHLVVCADPTQAGAYARSQRRLDALAHRLRSAGATYPDFPDPMSISESDFVSSFPKEKFLATVAQCKEYIAAGDIFQVQISQRLSVPYRARPLDVYRALRGVNPSPYMYFIDLGEEQIVGASPEILVRAKNSKITVRPIAGTRRRGRTAEEDQRMEVELLNDPKERAEHVMLIDLGRNDIGRVATSGSVRVTDTMVVEKYSHVMHIVSEVVGDLPSGHSFIDVLRATFPAGTLTGAPKVHATELIHQMEPVKRGVYGGAVGYINWWDEADMAIAIRTAIIKDRQLHAQAAAGVVADSIAENEWQETMNKCRAMFTAVAAAVKGL
jgi:anthranilate synthase component I